MKLSAKVIEAAARAGWLVAQERSPSTMVKWEEQDDWLRRELLEETEAAILAAIEAMVAEGNAVNARCRWALDQGDTEPDWIASTIAAPTDGNFPVLIIRTEQT